MYDGMYPNRGVTWRASGRKPSGYQVRRWPIGCPLSKLEKQQVLSALTRMERNQKGEHGNEGRHCRCMESQ